MSLRVAVRSLHSCSKYQLLNRVESQYITTRSSSPRLPHFLRLTAPRSFSSTRPAPIEISRPKQIDIESGSSQSQPAKNLDQNVTQEEKDHYNKMLQEDKGKQIRTPWHRDGADRPPIATQREASAMTKGKLLTTPSRMLKLILPLTTSDLNSDRKDVEPLALLVHPQQPLSYLERLIQSELPAIVDKDGKERIPNVYFRAEDSIQDGIEAQPEPEENPDEADEHSHKDIANPDTTMIEGKSAKTGKLNNKPKAEDLEGELRGEPGEGGVESYSGLGREAKTSDEEDAGRGFVRWSSSTEIGDFIRDAARGKEFAVEIEGAPNEIRVGVPSFGDRTYYLRMRLRKKAKEISRLADVKKECDEIAERGAKRVAVAGGGLLVAWWGTVYYLTFQTNWGWDTMEPVTYLVGLSTLIGGYLWFLVHNKQVSYRSAMHITISKRQSQLYEQRGFDLRRWEDLIEDGNKLRAEIKNVAQEYDVDWHETDDETSEKVRQALKKEREKKKNGKKDKKDDDDEEEDD